MFFSGLLLTSIIAWRTIFQTRHAYQYGKAKHFVAHLNIRQYNESNILRIELSFCTEQKKSFFCVKNNISQ